MRSVAIQNPKSKFQNKIGGGVWESNPPKHALAYSQTVLKTAPITGQDAPPQGGNILKLVYRNFRRMNHDPNTIEIPGTQIQRASLPRTNKPRELKKSAPIGETSMGLHGKKNRSLLNGASSATPKPPLVSMSNNGCESVTHPKYNASFHLDTFVPTKQNAPIAPRNIAKAIE